MGVNVDVRRRPFFDSFDGRHSRTIPERIPEERSEKRGVQSLVVVVRGMALISCTHARVASMAVGSLPCARYILRMPGMTTML